MIASKEWIGERLVIHFCGTFDPAAEWEFYCVLAEVTVDCQVTAVFNQVLDFHDIDRDGVGLGLFSARQLVAPHGGRVRVDSVPGAGATFFVDLPVQPGDEQSAPS
jgi:hypothetical protein